jgi:hypothetical protein
MAKKLTSTKAKKILHDKEVHGHPLTEQQRKFFGAIAGGAKPYKAQFGGVGNLITGFHPRLAETASEVLSAPQKAATQLVTGKYQTPSEALDIQNAAGAFLTDVVLDPLGLLGIGAAKKMGALDNVYNINPFAKKTLSDPNKSYRVAGMDAYDDFVESGFLRSKTPMPQSGMSFAEKMEQRPTAFPSFQKGFADLRYLPKEGGVVFETSLPTFKRGEINPVTGFPVKGRHYAHRVVDPETGKTVSKIPAKDIKVFEPKPHWLRGYKEVKPPKKKQDGGWLDKFDAPQAQNGIEGTMGGLTDKGFNYNGAWGGPSMQMGGNIMPAMAGANQTVPMAQTGTRQPIYTSDLERVKSYQDSLTAYNKTKGWIDKVKQLEATYPKGSPILRKALVNDYIRRTKDNFLYNYFDYGRGKKATKHYENEMNVTFEHEKPVQPVAYRKRELEKPNLSVDLPNIELTDVRPAIAQPTFEQARVDMSKPTKYSYTYPTFDKDVQKTMYFPDRNSWKTFVEQQRGASSQEGKDYGSATGQFAMGGSLPGAVGFTYARTAGAAPSEGPYAKKTLPSAQQGKSVDASKEFLKDWYSNRKITDQYIQGAFDLDRPAYMKNLQSLPEYTVVDSIDNNPNITGRYEGDTNKLLITKGAPEHVKTHELNHYLNTGGAGDYMRTIHGEIAKNELLPQSQVQGVYKDKYDYFSNPDEVHSRIMVLREKAGIKPNETVTPEKLKGFMKTYKGDVDNINDLLNMSKGEEGLLNMLNFMAKGKSSTPTTAQNGQEMSFYQHGLDWTPRNISRNGGWLDKYDAPQAQTGKMLEYLKSKKTAPVVTKGEPMSEEMQKRITAETLRRQTQKNKPLTATNTREQAVERGRAENLRVIEENKEYDRQAMAEGKAAEATRENPNVPFTFPTGESKLWKDMDRREQQYVSGRNLGSMSRSNNWTDWINPITMIGEMGEGLATAPYMARETDSNLPYAVGIGSPLLTGALGGAGTKGTKKTNSLFGKSKEFPKRAFQYGGDIPVDPMGYWNPENVGSPVIIPSNVITMEDVDQPLVGVSDTGDVQYMMPGEDYEFDGEYVTEYPVAKKGISVNNADAQPLKKLDQLLNFTNYNKPTKGGWLDKYN